MTDDIQNNDTVSDSPDNKESDAAGATPPRSSRLLHRKELLRKWGPKVAVVVLAVLLGYFYYSLHHESTDDAFIDADIVPVSSRVPGHVLKINVDDNRWVKAGDILVELDPQDFTTRLDAAQAALESATAANQAQQVGVALTKITATSELDEARDNVAFAKASVQEATARLTMSRAALDQAGAEVVSAKARHESDATDLGRCQKMAKTRTVSQQDLDHAATAEKISAAALSAAQKRKTAQKAAVKEAGAALKAAQANLRTAQARLVTAQSAPQRIEQSRFQAGVSGSKVDQAKAVVEQARLNLSYTKIVAPCDGFVTQKSIEPGQFVQVGQSLLAIVPRTVWVTANFKETQLTHMKPGQPVKIKVDAYPHVKFSAHIDSIQRGTGAKFSLLPAENATGNYVKVTQRVPVKILFDQPAKDFPVLLTPGMSVVPDVNVGAKGYAGRRSARAIN